MPTTICAATRPTLCGGPALDSCLHAVDLWDWLFDFPNDEQLCQLRFSSSSLINYLIKKSGYSAQSEKGIAKVIASHNQPAAPGTSACHQQL